MKNNTNPVVEFRGQIAILVLSVIIPLFLWARQVSLANLFTGSYNTLSTLAQTAGLVGLSLFAVNIILSGRYKFIDRLFLGLDRAYRTHRLTGITAFSLMLAHVGGVSARALTVSNSALAQLWLDLTNTALVFGRLSFLGFLIVILVTLFAKLPYEWLKRNHQTLGLFLFLGGLHAYLIPSDIAVNQPLRWYVLGLTTVGVGSYLWRTLLKPWLVPRQLFLVTAVNKLNETVTEIVMKPKNDVQFTFTPGQFNFYKFIQPGFPSEDHPFSITAGAGEGHLRISAKALGDFTAQLPQLETGAEVLVQGPFGGFSYKRGAKEQIWLAGGIGITPFISMARTLSKSPAANPYTINLFYSVTTANEAVYRAELEEIALKLPGFKFHLWLTDKNGYLTAQAISQLTSLHNKDIFICGPPALIEALTKQLKQAGVPSRRIRFERFKLL